MPTHSDPAKLKAARESLLGRPELVGAPLRKALTELYDRWLTGLVPKVPGVALVAVGGLGRREPAPYSDLDLMLVHSGRTGQVAEIADAIWYPVWDAKVGLDHSVRTVEQALAVAKEDLKAALGLLYTRHIAGDVALTGRLRDAVLEAWRADAVRRLPELLAAVRERWVAHGEAAFLLEPQLKESRGGLRDVHALQALAAAQLADWPSGAVGAAYGALLDVRGELHRRAGRPQDRLVLQEQAGIASVLGHADDTSLLRAVSESARTVAFAVDTAWRRVDTELATRRSRWRGRRRSPERRPLAAGVVEQDGEVVLARDADPWSDPGLMLRAAAAAARSGRPLAPFALSRLATESAPLPEPWPADARDSLVALLSAGRPALPVLEALDQAGLMVRLIPEWEQVRFLPQHNAIHRFTVDRHLMETAAAATELARRVARPDLLVLGAFLHDIGKGFPGDHSRSGAEVARRVAVRLGLPAADVETVQAMARWHLLLPDTATHRDLEDPATVRVVTDAVSGSSGLLELLHALAQADARATGPGVWTEWKAGLITDLVRRAARALTGAPPPGPTELAPAVAELAAVGELAVRLDGDQVTVVAPDARGLLSRTAGVLALHLLDVRAADIRTLGETAVNVFVVAPRFGRPPDPALLRDDLRRALAGMLPLGDRIAAKEAAYPTSSGAAIGPPPRVLWLDDAATDATVLELRAADAVGLLYRVTAALERCAVDVRAARLETLGGAVVDAFYLVGSDGKPLLDGVVRSGIEEAVLAATGS
ncbi:MAG TPA: [protein-PII] uridylyltransferase [Mycobacteriales bacterium]|nr:[protein-PII] uridylyltransferase [Mycobacteriales bacterium]